MLMWFPTFRVSPVKVREAAMVLVTFQELATGDLSAFGGTFD